MTEREVTVAEVQEEDLPFLFELWHTPDVMCYADEFPKLRGWSKSDDPQAAWVTYQKRQASLGKAYVQLILSLGGKMRIGESFFAPIPDGYSFGKWQKPEGTLCLMGDIKLRPAYWGRGLGSQGMRRVVPWLFANTECSLLVVPPHRKNPAAQRVYEKAGFELYTGMRSWRNHRVMQLSRQRYERIGNSGAPP